VIAIWRRRKMRRRGLWCSGIHRLIIYGNDLVIFPPTACNNDQSASFISAHSHPVLSNLAAVIELLQAVAAATAEITLITSLDALFHHCHGVRNSE
jgi:hypothetical protein